MKRSLRPIAVLAIASMMMTACQKESFNENMQTSNRVQYTVSGSTQSVTLSDDESWDLFLEHLFALAKEGETVVIWGSSSSEAKYKETVTFTTTSEGEAKNWTAQMLAQGYTVSINYDEQTGVYTCIAQR